MNHIHRFSFKRSIKLSNDSVAMATIMVTKVLTPYSKDVCFPLLFILLHGNGCPSKREELLEIENTVHAT